MTSKDYIYKGRGVSNLKAHLVLVTKYRKEIINNSMLDFLEGVFRRTIEKWEGRLIEFNGEPDHIHIIFQYNPQTELSKLINNLKTVSSRLVNKEYPEKKNWKGAFWNSSYFISSCGGVTVEKLKEYIQKQERPTQ